MLHGGAGASCSAFVPLIGVDLKLLLSVRHERTVNNDSVVSFELQPVPSGRTTCAVRSWCMNFPRAWHQLSGWPAGALHARWPAAVRPDPARPPSTNSAANGNGRSLLLSDASRAWVSAPGYLLPLGEQLSTMWTRQSNRDALPRTAPLPILPSTMWLSFQPSSRVQTTRFKKAQSENQKNRDNDSPSNRADICNC